MKVLPPFTVVTSMVPIPFSVPSLYFKSPRRLVSSNLSAPNVTLVSRGGGSFVPFSSMMVTVQVPWMFLASSLPGSAPEARADTPRRTAVRTRRRFIGAFPRVKEPRRAWTDCRTRRPTAQPKSASFRQSQRPQHQVAHRRQVDVVRRRWAVADQQRPVRRLRRPQTVTALHQRRVQRHDIEERPEAELLLRQPPRRAQLRRPQLRVEEQLAGIIARLAVDVDGAGVIRRLPII